MHQERYRTAGLSRAMLSPRAAKKQGTPQWLGLVAQCFHHEPRSPIKNASMQAASQKHQLWDSKCLEKERERTKNKKEKGGRKEQTDKPKRTRKEEEQEKKNQTGRPKRTQRTNRERTRGGGPNPRDQHRGVLVCARRRAGDCKSLSVLAKLMLLACCLHAFVFLWVHLG